MSSPQIKLSKMVDMQRRNVPDVGNYGKLIYSDIKRLDRFIDGDIFGNMCCLYNGERKSNYTTMSFRSKKISVLRLLYHNYTADITRTDKIKYVCDNKGICCNLNHIKIQTKEFLLSLPPLPKKRQTLGRIIDTKESTVSATNRTSSVSVSSMPANNHINSCLEHDDRDNGDDDCLYHELSFSNECEYKQTDDEYDVFQMEY
jgi:hypothetical protein